MMRKINIIGVVFLSAGWLWPASVSTYYLMSWLDDEVSDLLRGHPSIYSFDFTLHLKRWAFFTLAWFSVAVLFWMVIATVRLFPKQTDQRGKSTDA
jgi:hypothetical protein